MPFNPLRVVMQDVVGRHVDYKGVRRRAYGANSKTAQFIAWDGEGIRMPPTPIRNGFGLWVRDGKIHEADGCSLISFTPEPQPYVLLANSGPKGGEPQRIIAKDPKKGLTTHECFQFLLSEKQKYQNSIFVGFGFNYDVNQILASWPDRWLRQLYEKNEVLAGNYYVKWYPRKFFNITQIRPRPKRSVVIYDTFGFFQSSFLEACRKYLGGDDLTLIERGKEGRSLFDWEDLEDFIIPYNNMELEMLVRMMDILRADLAKVEVYPSQWHGPGAVATKVMTKYKIPIVRCDKEVNRAAQFAMAGGRFEQYGLGHYRGTVYEADIHSAYPAAATELPDLSEGYWEHVKSFEPGTFGVWHIDYVAPYSKGRLFEPKPLFCRAEHGNIAYPSEVQGWYWTPEAELCADRVREGYVFRERTTRRPFDFIPEMYRQRMEYKAVGNSAERALKLILNSLYGKTAQTVGGKKEHPKDDCLEPHWNPRTRQVEKQECPHLQPPKWHQLEYAGYITSRCRAKVYAAMMLNPSAIIAAETDAVFSTEKLALPYSDELGDWELQEYSSIVYLQNGFYYAVTDQEADEDTPIEATSYDGKKIKCRFRGLDTDRNTKQPTGLPYRHIVDQLSHYIKPLARKTPALHSTAHRYIGLGLKFNTLSTWRAWEDVEKAIVLDGNHRSSKRFHLREHCAECLAGHTLNDSLHPLMIGGYSGQSHARTLPWIGEPMENVMNDKEKDWSYAIDKFQP